MLLYFVPIIILFLLSNFKTTKKIDFVVIFLLMLFLCFGYMTGSDWRGYEEAYYYGFLNRLVEPGYMYISNFLSEKGVDFWTFHILFKCLSFLLIVLLIFTLSGKRHLYFSLALWYASYGLYMFIDCPFRNTIACGISSCAFIFLLRKKLIMYFLLVALAMSFHMSAIVLTILPFISLAKLSSKSLVLIYITIFIIFAFGGTIFLQSILNSYLPSFLSDRIDYYQNSSGSVFSMGIISRLLCLFLIIKYRDKIILNNKYGEQTFMLCYVFLIISLIYYVLPMLFRSALFLGPFYAVGFSMGLAECYKKNIKLLKSVVFAIFIVIVFLTVSKIRYVPYSNILRNIISGTYYDFNYRSNYNYLNSPYRE